MDSTKADFTKRKEEVSEYFSFLKILNMNDSVSLEYKDPVDKTNKNFPIERRLQTIFIANTFLLLYNLVESTIRNSITEIYIKIKEDKVSYQNLSGQMKKIWLRKTRKSLVERGRNNGIEGEISGIIDNIIKKEIIELTINDTRISGNIDAQRIRELAKENGFDIVKDGSILKNIKEKRNFLAHGNQTFDDIGKNITYKDLDKYREDTFSYLTQVIQNIETFIEKQEYKKVNNKEVWYIKKWLI